MRRRIGTLFILIAVEWLAAAAPVRAQVDLAGCKVAQQEAPRSEKLNDNHFRLVGSEKTPVMVECDQTQLVADEMELFRDQNKVVARGHVVYSSPENRIYADRLEFDTKTKLGTFYKAYGTAHLGERADRSMFGTQEPYAYFYGEEIHKTGPKTYKIIRGGFTTCVQPTPRWEVTSGSVTIEMDDHAILRHSLFRVKGVPLMYLPIFYYPIQEDDRATGFLMPLYGNSTYKGQSISNQFFWAISRSQDLTLAHDWFTRTGQGYGAEYRYVASSVSSGDVRYYRLSEKSAAFTTNGVTVETPGGSSFNLHANVRQALPASTRLTAAVDYFSSIATQQLYQQDLFESTQRSRTWTLATTSSWGGFNVLSAWQRLETFYGEDDSSVYGVRPRLSLSRGATRLGPAPVYVSGSVDYSKLVRQSRAGERLQDSSSGRLDAIGIVRVPFPAFPFIAVNSSVMWRGTQYDRSLSPVTGQLVPEPVFRRYLEFASELVGPSIVRIWHRPTGNYARRVKHVIEPRVEWRRWTAIENVDRIFKYDSGDFLFGNQMQLRYGVANRILVKGAAEDAVSRTLLTVSVQQTYYTDPVTSQFDPAYATAFLGRPPSDFSPVAISASLTPTEASSATGRVEYDPIINAIQNISLGGSLRRANVEVTGSFSKRRLDINTSRFQSANLISTSTTFRTSRNDLGATYSFTHDFGRGSLVQQRILGFYNAQCCGIGVEYQEYNYPQIFRFAIPRDRRFNVSFSLAGIGTFSNFLGALAGQPTTTRR